jgi:hypothetical protein
MPARPSTHAARATQVVMMLPAALLLVACAATSGGAAPHGTAGPSAAPPDATSGPATTAYPTATDAAAPSAGGPVDYALWVERQGFGGSSGLRQVLKGANWIRDHSFEATVFEVDDELGYATRLATWLDEHPPTACWTEYHAIVRATLDRVLDAYAAAHDARAAGEGIPLEVGETLVAEAQAAFDVPAPSGC